VTAPAPAFETRRLAPFGMAITFPDGTDMREIDADAIHAWVAEHRVVVFRGLRPFEKVDMPAVARRLGPLLAWPFGAINELVPAADAQNYLYTTHEVPLHWDGAFVGNVPRYLFFHCLEAPDVDGGETVFVDTTRVWGHADESTRRRWRALAFVYETEKLAHYGGRFESAVVASHPYTHETILRFAEPVDDLNPVTVDAKGLGASDSARAVAELRGALASDDALLEHAWAKGDVVVADNHALLHGRRAFAGGERRHIRRINVLGSERTWRHALRDSIRIRRPEFMVAEVPILLIPMFVATRSAMPVGLVVELTALFFLLFHFGDMINCFADRELDAVYKTNLSEAVYGLGTRNVVGQMVLTVAAAIVLAGHVAFRTGRPEIVGLVLFGLALGAQYSVGPLRLKSRGLWQVLCLWAVIFVGPMLLVMRTVGGAVAWPLVALVGAYGALQQGIILVNTAEDLPEDRAARIRTSAVALGLRGCLRLATSMVGLFGAAVIVLFTWMAGRGGGNVALAVLPLCVAWGWVTWEIARIGAGVKSTNEAAAIKAMRPHARRMPLWITATAWTSLWAAACVGSAWSLP
jgi:alpha-ketoglutarate-dependent taurine dioxygenase/4-hydroxybenzoate polyprenyltransferase